MFPARIKKGIAIRVKESIPPKRRTAKTDNGISSTKSMIMEENAIAIYMGIPMRMKMMNSRNSITT